MIQNFPKYVSTEVVLIKSPFVETTRSGKHLNSVNIALTPTTLIITSSQDSKEQFIFGNEALQSYESNHLLQTTKLQIFKKSQRQSIKVSLGPDETKYYELKQSIKSKIYWSLWCIHVGELNRKRKSWPFVPSQSDKQCSKENFAIKQILPWMDKYLYLGSKRAAEDNDKPKPVPGLGPTEVIKLLYLKPKYFGCWDQSEHWVQCNNSCSSCNE